jgi:hypothetical protein
MYDNPLLVAAIAIGLFIVFLAIYTFFTYMFLKLATKSKTSKFFKK